MDNKNQETKKVGLYVRVSTEEQASTGVSLDAQREKLRQYCSFNGWSIAGEYMDAGLSGGTMDRPQLQKLIEDGRNGRINVVLVYKLDRLSRSLRDIILTIDDFRAHKIDFVSLTEQIDTTTPVGKLMFHIIGAFAEFERDMIRDRVIMGMDKKAKDGCVQYKAPLGYRYLDGKIVVDEEEAAKIKRIFADYIKYRSMAKVAQIHSLPNAKTVQRILSNETYLGYVKWKGIKIKGVHDAIVDEGIFNKVKKIRAEMRKKNKEKEEKTFSDR